MKLHWSPKSPYVRKVMVCAHELGRANDIELKRSVAAMLRPNAELMRDNPLSKIPALVLDDGQVLFDSRVICEYLDTQGPGKLFPTTGHARWQALCWQALGDGLLDLLILWRNERERPAATQLLQLLEAFALKNSACLARLEAHVAALESTPLSIGHISVGCALGYLDFRFADLRWREVAPCLARWNDAIQKRPSFGATSPSLDT